MMERFAHVALVALLTIITVSVLFILPLAGVCWLLLGQAVAISALKGGLIGMLLSVSATSLVTLLGRDQ